MPPGLAQQQAEVDVRGHVRKAEAGRLSRGLELGQGVAQAAVGFGEDLPDMGVTGPQAGGPPQVREGFGRA